ncbi:Zinc-binding oxidoreductase alcohol dehydrogenase, partial [Fusarium falciforme]
IIVVASRKHEKLLKEYGADELFDYHDADVIEQIKKKYNNIPYLVDCVSNTETIQQVYKCAADDLDATVVQLTVLTEKDIKEEGAGGKTSVLKEPFYI